jgi:hypothetical protein
MDCVVSPRTELAVEAAAREGERRTLPRLQRNLLPPRVHYPTKENKDSVEGGDHHHREEAEESQSEWIQLMINAMYQRVLLRMPIKKCLPRSL